MSAGEEAVIALPEDVRVAVANALARVGLTFEQLARLGSVGKWTSDLQRRTWIAIKDLGEYAEPR